MAMASVVDHHYKRRLGWRRRRIAAHSSSIQTFFYPTITLELVQLRKKVRQKSSSLHSSSPLCLVILLCTRTKALNVVE